MRPHEARRDISEMEQGEHPIAFTFHDDYGIYYKVIEGTHDPLWHYYYIEALLPQSIYGPGEIETLHLFSKLDISTMMKEITQTDTFLKREIKNAVMGIQYTYADALEKRGAVNHGPE